MEEIVEKAKKRLQDAGVISKPGEPIIIDVDYVEVK